MFIETERLFINVSVKMERFDCHIRPLNGTFQQCPKAFNPVRVYMVSDIGFGVGDHFMRVFVVQSFIASVFICIDITSSFYAITALRLKRAGAIVFSMNFAGRSIPNVSEKEAPPTL